VLLDTVLLPAKDRYRSLTLPECTWPLLDILVTFVKKWTQIKQTEIKYQRVQIGKGVKAKRHKTNGCKTRAACKGKSMNSNDHSFFI